MYRQGFPHYIQHDAMDCGPTCLRMIAKYYGRTIRYRRCANAPSMDVDGYEIFNNLKDSYSFLCYHPLDLKSIIETNLKSQTNLSSESIKQLTQLKESLNEDDNDILVLFKFK